MFSQHLKDKENTHPLVKNIRFRQLLALLSFSDFGGRVNISLWFHSHLDFSHYFFYHRNCQKPSFTNIWHYCKECSSFNVETEFPGAGISPSVQQKMLGLTKKCKISGSALWVCRCAPEHFSTGLRNCGPNGCGHRGWEGIAPGDRGVSFGVRWEQRKAKL